MLTAGMDRALDRGTCPGPRAGSAAMRRPCRSHARASKPALSRSACATSPGGPMPLRRCAGRCKPGGHFVCLEFSPAVLPQFKPLYDTYSFKVLPWLGQRVAGRRGFLRLSRGKHPEVSGTRPAGGRNDARPASATSPRHRCRAGSSGCTRAGVSEPCWLVCAIFAE